MRREAYIAVQAGAEALIAGRPVEFWEGEFDCCYRPKPRLYHGDEGEAIPEGWVHVMTVSPDGDIVYPFDGTMPDLTPEQEAMIAEIRELEAELDARAGEEALAGNSVLGGPS